MIIDIACCDPSHDPHRIVQLTVTKVNESGPWQWQYSQSDYPHFRVDEIIDDEYVPRSEFRRKVEHHFPPDGRDWIPGLDATAIRRVIEARCRPCGGKPVKWRIERFSAAVERFAETGQNYMVVTLRDLRVL